MRHKTAVPFGRKLCFKDLGNRLWNSNLPVKDKQPEVSSLELTRVCTDIQHSSRLKIPN